MQKAGLKLPIKNNFKLQVRIQGNMGEMGNAFRVIFILSFILFWISWIFHNRIDNLFKTKEEKSKCWGNFF